MDEDKTTTTDDQSTAADDSQQAQTTADDKQTQDAQTKQDDKQTVPVFDPKPMQEQLDRLEKKFGKEGIAALMTDRYGDNDRVQQLEARLDKSEIDTARANLALKHKLTPTQAAAIPGKTPEEVAANLDAMLAFAEERKPAEVEAPASPFSIPQKIEDKPELSVKDAEAAIRRAGGGYTRN